MDDEEWRRVSRWLARLNSLAERELEDQSACEVVVEREQRVQGVTNHARDTVIEVPARVIGEISVDILAACGSIRLELGALSDLGDGLRGWSRSWNVSDD